MAYPINLKCVLWETLSKKISISWDNCLQTIILENVRKAVKFKCIYWLINFLVSIQALKIFLNQKLFVHQ